MITIVKGSVPNRVEKMGTFRECGYFLIFFTNYATAVEEY
jgi:hypothetical protein